MAGSYDAVVVGAGAAGTFAADLLGKGGLRVLVLDAGAPRSWLLSKARQFGRKVIRRVLRSRANLVLTRQPIQSQCYAWASDPEAFVDDKKCPYVSPTTPPFVWLRARQLGGRMMVPGHGRQYYRFCKEVFDPGDGLSEPWPFRAAELDSAYAEAEKWLELSGAREGLAHLPDSEIARPIRPTAGELEIQRLVTERWPGAKPVMSRFAAFKSLDAVARSGRVHIRSGAMVREVKVAKTGAVEGVRWVDDETKQEHYTACPVVFLCASTLESTRILLMSQSPFGAGGIGATSGVLGRYLMDHIRVRASGRGAPIPYEGEGAPGRGQYIARLDARNEMVPNFPRGFSVQFNKYSGGSTKESTFGAVTFGEMLPRFENRVSLDPHMKDFWGIPVLRIECSHDSVDLQRAQDQAVALRELAGAIGIKLDWVEERPAAPGSANHECGTARMGSNSRNSVLDTHNECWEARGLYVTDAAAFPSQGCQNPTLTILALTARACRKVLQKAGA